jgi:uncharacterized protein (DUF934 family)
MARIIKNKAIVEDGWNVLKLAEGETAETVALPSGDVIFPLAVWQARRAEIEARSQFGIWLDAAEGPEAIADDLGKFALIAVNFPKFSDGRGFSTARLLRERYKYIGELRAIGDVLHDQLFFMHRCGFDAMALRADKDIEKAVAQAFTTFSDAYQTAVDQNLPHYRRRAA